MKHGAKELQTILFYTMFSIGQIIRLNYLKFYVYHMLIFFVETNPYLIFHHMRSKAYTKRQIYI